MDRFRLAVFNTQPPHLYFGGVERRIIETTKRLQSEADIAVFCGTKAGFREPATVNGVPIVPCHSTDWLYPLDNWTFNRSLTKQARTIDADIYEAHAVSGYGFPRRLKQLGIKKPLVHTIHGVLADEYEKAKTQKASFRGRVANRFMGHLAKLEGETAKQATLIATISRYSLENIQRHYDIDASNVRIVPNGVDTERFKPAENAETVRQQFNLGDEPCVLFVGSLIPRKGLPLLVEAAKRVVAQQANTRFLIVGEGPLKDQLTAHLEAAHLLGNFRFLGNLKEDALAALYGCVDVFVLPSIQEGQGIVLLEAQAAAVPVVAFDVGGVNEAVRNGETGLLVERGNTEMLAEALLKLISDEALRKTMGLNGRKFISETFTWDICARGMLKVYQEALKT